MPAASVGTCSVAVHHNTTEHQLHCTLHNTLINTDYRHNWQIDTNTVTLSHCHTRPGCGPEHGHPAAAGTKPSRGLVRLLQLVDRIDWEESRKTYYI